MFHFSTTQPGLPLPYGGLQLRNSHIYAHMPQPYQPSPCHRHHMLKYNFQIEINPNVEFIWIVLFVNAQIVFIQSLLYVKQIIYI